MTHGETPEDLEAFAVARWWADDVDAAIAARERAYALRREAGQTIEAARLAGLLAWDYGAMRGLNAVANGWLQRAQHLVAELPTSAEHAWLPLIEASFHLDTDAEAVLRLSTRSAELAREHGALDIEMTARTLRGLALVSLGQVGEGTRLLDEGTAAATSGELYDPIAIGSCCCNMIIACERTRDFDRAGQWCAQLAAFCERSGQRPLLALCRAHHGTVLMMRGEWAEAEQELDWAAGELATLRPPLAGYARARLAELRRRQGAPAAARALLEQAGTHVLVPLGQAQLALDGGEPDRALAHAERYLRRLGAGKPIESAGGLEVMAAGAIGLGLFDVARDAHRRLAAIAAAVGTDALHGAERSAAGALAAAQEDVPAATAAFEDAIDRFRASGAPYETAQAQLGLARAWPDGALAHAAAARAAFAALGARRATEQADRVLDGLGRRRDGGLTRREVEVLSLVAAGLSNRQVADRLTVSEHTVHRHMANVYARLGVSSRAAAVARAAHDGLLEDGPNGR